MPESKRSMKKHRAVERAKMGKGYKQQSLPATRDKCPFPKNHQTERCCMCDGYVSTCPCTFGEAIAHAKRFHHLPDIVDLEEIEIVAGQARFLADLNDPDVIIHAEASDDNGGTVCGIELTFGLIVASSPDMANCPQCRGDHHHPLRSPQLHGRT